MSNVENERVYKIDITKEHCPMTFVKTKLALSKINDGDILEVILLKGEPLENVPKSLTEQGHKVLSIEHLHDDVYKLVVEK